MCFEEKLDIELMKEGAKLFEGEHNFRVYCTKPSPNAQFIRTIELSQIEENTTYTANFFPEKSYLYRVKSKGFMRNQVRLIMGQLIALGKGSKSLSEIKESLTGKHEKPLNFIAPASGLILNKVKFE